MNYGVVKLHSECSWNLRDPKTPAHEGCQQCSVVLVVTCSAWELPAIEQEAWFSSFWSSFSYLTSARCFPCMKHIVGVGYQASISEKASTFKDHLEC